MVTGKSEYDTDIAKDLGRNWYFMHMYEVHGLISRRTKPVVRFKAHV